MEHNRVAEQSYPGSKLGGLSQSQSISNGLAWLIHFSIQRMGQSIVYFHLHLVGQPRCLVDLAYGVVIIHCGLQQAGRTSFYLHLHLVGRPRRLIDLAYGLVIIHCGLQQAGRTSVNLHLHLVGRPRCLVDLAYGLTIIHCGLQQAGQTSVYLHLHLVGWPTHLSADYTGCRPPNQLDKLPVSTWVAGQSISPSLMRWPK